MATSKPMDGSLSCEKYKQDTVGELSERNMSGMKKVIDEGADRFWAKRGLQDQYALRIFYGKNDKRSSSYAKRAKRSLK